MPARSIPPPETAIDVVLANYAITASASQVPGGRLVFSVTNRDRAPHDLVLLATALPADRLPTEDIRVDEDDPAITVLARTPRLEPGTAATLTASVSAGAYVLVCTVPHHYVREQMVATLTAT